jgi:hypothetical protein
MDDYKTRMAQGLADDPQAFVEYAMADTDDLLKINTAFVDLIRGVQHETIGLPEEDCFTEDDIPSTTGSIVAITLERWIYNQIGDCSSDCSIDCSIDDSVISRDGRRFLKEKLNFAMRKLGILNPGARNYKGNLKSLINVLKRIPNEKTLTDALDELDTVEDIKTASEEVQQLHQFLRADFEFTALNQSSIGYLGIQLDTSCYGAIVQGGRCNNERPSEYRVEIGADVDLSSCYGTALKSFVYPVGLPSIISNQHNQERLKLRQFFKRYESKLVDNLWTVTVSGKLSFEQDLIYSKLVSQAQINRATRCKIDNWSNPDDDDIGEIPGDLVLTRSEITNGILTSDIWNAIKKVATNNELKEIYDLEVVTAVMYQKGNHCDSLKDWVSEAVNSKGKFFNRDNKFNEVSDSRTRKWTSLPLEGFIGKLVSKRQAIKGSLKNLPKDSEEYHRTNAMQEALKLFINTTYGVICSRYFPIGNTVVANNITARARLGAWMLNKALHTRQSITDGGIYGLTTVPELSVTAKLPGLDLLSDNLKWIDADKYTRTVQPLGTVDWVKVFDSDDQDTLNKLDKLASEHIANFWKLYGLQLPFQIEHKLKNCFKVAAYFQKGHYRMETLSGTVVSALRGSRDDKDGLRRHPTYQLMEHICKYLDIFPDQLEHDHKHLLSINDWKLADESPNEQAYQAYRDKRPGDEVIEARPAMYNNTHCQLDTATEFYDRANRRTQIDDIPQAWFERYGDLGIDQVVRHMVSDIL